MPSRFASVDFSKIVIEISSGRAFDDYPQPLGKTKASTLDPTFKNPSYPGENSYGNGPTVIPRLNLNLPNDLITAQRDSNKDAIHLYMSEKNMGNWMHEYFSGDFMASGAFRKLMAKLDFPKIWAFDTSTNELDANLSMKLDAPERSRHDRKMYTAMEMKLTQKICREVPSLALTVIAYQASYIEYLAKLGEAIEASPALNEKQKERGAVVVKNLVDNWSNNNFVNNILPAVAIHYYENHNRRIGEKPTQKDFTQGMKFAVEKGMFRNEATPPDGEVRKFVCPAKGILTRMSALSMGHEQSGQIQSETGSDSAAEGVGMNTGVGLYHIYREVEKSLEKDSHATKRAVGDLQTMITKSMVEKY